MKNFFSVFAVSLLVLNTAVAEPRTFTNKEGKALTAELISVVDEKAVLKLANLKKYKVPIDSLSEDDQKFIKEWWEENKNNVSEMDVRLEISKSVDRIAKPDEKKDKKNKDKSSSEEVQFNCVLESYTQRDLSDISVKYTIYKRVSTRDGDGSETKVEEITGSTTIDSLPSHEKATFETDAVLCKDESKKGGKDKPSESRRETVIGVAVTLSANGKEFMTQGYPDNFLDKIEDEDE